MKVAELLFKNGFKEAYAIRGGIRGKNGWQVLFRIFLVFFNRCLSIPSMLGSQFLLVELH